MQSQEAQILELLRVLELVVGRSGNGGHQTGAVQDDTAVLSAVVDIPASLWQVLTDCKLFEIFSDSRNTPIRTI